MSQTFAFVFTDLGSAADLASVQVKFGATTSNAGFCYLWVTPGTGGVRLDNDADTGWISAQALGTAGTLQNSQCLVNVGQSNAAMSGNT